jgi:hypothetical protein
MNSDEDEFDAMGAGFGAMRRGLDVCPNAAALAGFAADSLPSDEAARVRAHVSMCGVCDSLVESSRHFDDPVAGTPPGWTATERRLRGKVFPRSRRWLVLNLAVAYGIALTAVIIAVMPVRHPASSTPASPATVAPTPIELQSLRTIDLNTARGGGAEPVTLGSEDGFALLSFLIDIHPGFRYEASLDGRTAQPVASSDGKGNFAVLASRDLLSPGAHSLTITEINPSTGKVERSLDFPFQL